MKKLLSIITLIMVGQFWMGCSPDLIVTGKNRPSQVQYLNLKEGYPKESVSEALGVPIMEMKSGQDTVALYHFTLDYSDFAWEVGDTEMVIIAAGSPMSMKVVYDEQNQVKTFTPYKGWVKMRKGKVVNHDAFDANS